MKNTAQKIIVSVLSIGAFLLQLMRGLTPAGGELSGAQPGLFAVVFSALLAAAAVFAVLKLLFWVYARCQKKEKRKK